MSEWKARRFWKDTAVVEQDGGWSITLDGRPVRTPAKNPLVVPTKALAQDIQAEWDAQDETIDPGTMPFTRTANSAIDKVAPQLAEIIEIVAAYGETDLLCYRATSPDALIARQAAAWDPLLDWAAETLNARLVTTAGVIPVDQPPVALAALRAEVARLGNFHLAAFHDLVALSGSLVIGLAVLHNRDSVQTLWNTSRVDEIWQAELWGEDEEATDVATRRWQSFLHAAEVLLRINVSKRPL